MTDDIENLDDLAEVVDAIRKAVNGIKTQDRESFIFNLGFARGRLHRVYARIQESGELDRVKKEPLQ